MRILVVADETLPLPGGAATWLMRLSSALSARFQLGLLVPRSRERWATASRPAAVPVFTVPTLLPADPEGADRKSVV